MTDRLVRGITLQVGEEPVLGSIIYYAVFITTGLKEFKTTYMKISSHWTARRMRWSHVHYH